MEARSAKNPMILRVELEIYDVISLIAKATLLIKSLSSYFRQPQTNIIILQKSDDVVRLG